VCAPLLLPLLLEDEDDEADDDASSALSMGEIPGKRPLNSRGEDEGSESEAARISSSVIDDKPCDRPSFVADPSADIELGLPSESGKLLS